MAEHDKWDIKKLIILRTLRERGTVTAAAEALLLTPSAVSQQLTNLAKQLGVPLLEAQGRRVRLTGAAHLVLRHAEAVFEQLERADAELAAYAHGEVGEVRVAAFSTSVPALVVPVVRALRVARPGVRVQVREAEAGEAYELLGAGEVDLALSLAARAVPDAGDGRFTRVPLLADPLDVALPVDHALAGVAEVRLADLAGEAWIFGGSGPWSDITRGRARRPGSHLGRGIRRPGGPPSSPWWGRGWGSRWCPGWLWLGPWRGGGTASSCGPSTPTGLGGMWLRLCGVGVRGRRRWRPCLTPCGRRRGR